MTQSQRELANSTAGIGAPSSSTYMVDRYRHLLDGQRERAAERLDAYLTGARPGARKPQTASFSSSG